MVVRVDICVATFQRPQLLMRLLESVSVQSTRNADIRVIVIDNDSQASAKAVIDQIRAAFPFPVIYEIEPKRGISHARNRALSLVTAELFAFLDDDECVPPDWLQLLLNAQQFYDADVVLGPVIGILPPDAPAWALAHPSFKRRRHRTGTRMKSGGIGNALLRASILGNLRHQFDDAFALTGGEDTDFLHRLYLNGRKLVWCNEALVYEEVSPARLTTSWAYRRALRGGQCYARIFYVGQPMLPRVSRIIYKGLQLLFGFLLAPALRVVSYPAYVRMFCRVCSAVGELHVLLGGRQYYKEYAEPLSGAQKASRDLVNTDRKYRH